MENFFHIKTLLNDFFSNLMIAISFFLFLPLYSVEWLWVFWNERRNDVCFVCRGGGKLWDVK